MLSSMQIRPWQQDFHRGVDVSSSVQRDTLMDQHDPFFSVEDTASACEARISTPREEERDGTEDTISNWVSPSDPNRNTSFWMDLRCIQHLVFLRCMKCPRAEINQLLPTLPVFGGTSCLWVLHGWRIHTEGMVEQRGRRQLTRQLPERI